MYEVLGFPIEALPPPEKLTEEQAAQLNDAILKLWEVNNIGADFPVRLPSQIVLHKEFRLKWQEATIRLLPAGNCHLDFCYYVENECPWGMDFCTCKDEDWYKEVDIEPKDASDDSLPF